MTSSPIESINEHFSDVNDPRQQGKVDHPLINIIFITICGVLCGADNWVAITTFGNSQVEWLSQYLNLKNGIPSHDTFGKTFAVIDSEQFGKGFLNWMQAVCEVVTGVVALDGKQ